MNDSTPQTTPETSAEIIDLRVGQRPDGKIVMSHVGGRWRNAEFERRKAEADTKRLAVEQAGKARL